MMKRIDVNLLTHARHSLTTEQTPRWNADGNDEAIKKEGRNIISSLNRDTNRVKGHFPFSS